MFKYIVAAAIAVNFTTAALAQTAFSASGSQSQSSSQSGSLSGASSNNSITFNTPSGTSSVVSGTTTLRTAPPVQAPSMGSGHPCAIAPVSLGISVIGGGASGSGQVIDEACLLAQMGQGEAALYMIARRDEEACIALRHTGRIARNSLCTDAEKKAAKQPRVSTRNAPTQVKLAYSKCEKTGNKITFRKAAGADSAAAKAACMASLGY